MERLKPAPTFFRPGAFSLVELLAVMAVVAMLIGLAGMSLTRSGEGLRLTGAADAAVAMFGHARQLATTTNDTHELRVYLWEEEGAERLGFFLYRVKVDEGAAFTGESHVFDDAVRLAEDLTTIFGSLPVLSGPPPAHSTGVENARHVRLSIHPSGATNLAAAGTEPGEHLLTLTTSRDAARGGSPRNFVSILIDPRNASVSALRPL